LKTQACGVGKHHPNDRLIPRPTEPMLRNAFKMKLLPGCEAEYKKRHDEIWPELSQALKDAGVSDYSIFLDPETLTLFAVQKLADNHSAGGLPDLPIVRKWWDSMAPLMEVHADNSPVCLPLFEVFHAD
jgi:L-rhamnose mutarotase